MKPQNNFPNFFLFYSNSISNILRITLFIILSKYSLFTKLLKD